MAYPFGDSKFVYKQSLQVAVRSRWWACGRVLAGILSSNPTGGMDMSPVFVLSGRGLCDGPIPRPEESYRL
jgi:hypothetical protein